MAEVAAAPGSAKTTSPGPLTLDQAALGGAPGGNPSSVTEPSSETAAAETARSESPSKSPPDARTPPSAQTSRTRTQRVPAGAARVSATRTHSGVVISPVSKLSSVRALAASLYSTTTREPAGGEPAPARTYPSKANR